MQKFVPGALKSVLTSLILTSLLVVSPLAFSVSIEEAQEFFDQRDYSPQGIANAKSSADMYSLLASVATNPIEKAELLIL